MSLIFQSNGTGALHLYQSMSVGHLYGYNNICIMSISHRYYAFHSLPL